MNKSDYLKANYKSQIKCIIQYKVLLRKRSLNTFITYYIYMITFLGHDVIRLSVAWYCNHERVDPTLLISSSGWLLAFSFWIMFIRSVWNFFTFRKTSGLFIEIIFTCCRVSFYKKKKRNRFRVLNEINPTMNWNPTSPNATHLWKQSPGWCFH